MKAYLQILEMVEKNKQDISEISLVGICDDFGKYVENNVLNGSINLEKDEVMEFLKVLLRLGILKSKSLISNNISNDKDEEEIDMKDFKERLLMVKKVKMMIEIIKKLSNDFEVKLRKMSYFDNNKKENKKEVFFDLKKEYLLSSIEKMKNNFEKINPKKVLKPKKIEMIEMNKIILGYLEGRWNEGRGFVDFKEIDIRGKEEKCASFLALLSLNREGYVKVSQRNNFDSILVEKNI